MYRTNSVYHPVQVVFIGALKGGRLDGCVCLSQHHGMKKYLFYLFCTCIVPGFIDSSVIILYCTVAIEKTKVVLFRKSFWSKKDALLIRRIWNT